MANRVKTINITTKKANSHGLFSAKAVAGVGTDGNYDESINNAPLRQTTGRYPLLGQANDINKQNFTPQDILGKLRRQTKREAEVVEAAAFGGRRGSRAAAESRPSGPAAPINPGCLEP